VVCPTANMLPYREIVRQNKNCFIFQVLLFKGREKVDIGKNYY
jgi:hypothetical protein